MTVNIIHLVCRRNPSRGGDVHYVRLVQVKRAGLNDYLQEKKKHKGKEVLLRTQKIDKDTKILLSLKKSKKFMKSN